MSCPIRKAPLRVRRMSAPVCSVMTRMFCAGGHAQSSGQVKIGDLLQTVNNIVVSLAAVYFQNPTKMAQQHRDDAVNPALTFIPCCGSFQVHDNTAEQVQQIIMGQPGTRVNLGIVRPSPQEVYQMQHVNPIQKKHTFTLTLTLSLSHKHKSEHSILNLQCE